LRNYTGVPVTNFTVPITFAWTTWLQHSFGHVDRWRWSTFSSYCVICRKSPIVIFQHHCPYLA